MEVTIRFGALSPPLHEQLGVDETELELEQKLADAVVLCMIHGTLTNAEYTRACNRLWKKIVSRMKEITQ